MSRAEAKGESHTITIGRAGYLLLAIKSGSSKRH